ncbi:hypothetical protein Hanom_Chr03g00239691 [Helianthus anomalus]
MFNNEAVNELLKKVTNLEKEKAKTEAERDALKVRVEELMKANDQIKMVLIDQEEKINKMEEDGEEYPKMFNVMQEEISKMKKELEKMNDINQTLNHLLSEVTEASSNEMKSMKLEMEAMKANKVIKDNQLSMLYVVIESHLEIDVHTAFNDLEVKRTEERRIERERRLAEEATQKKKGVIVETQEAGGSSSQKDVEMVEAEAEPRGFVLVGESPESFDPYEIIRRVTDIQKKKKANEILLLEWKTQQFVLVGKPYTVPYSAKEIARQIKIKERKRKAKIARGEIVDEDSDIELFRDEEEDEDENVDDNKTDEKDDKDDKDDKGNDDDDQGTSRLLIGNPNVQERIKELLNDEINEQEDDPHYEASSSGKQHADQIEIQRTREEMLEELGLEDGRFMFDIEDEIPKSSEYIFEPRYAYEADHYDDVIIEDASDTSDEETDFHYSGIDETFP